MGTGGHSSSSCPVEHSSRGIVQADMSTTDSRGAMGLGQAAAGSPTTTSALGDGEWGTSALRSGINLTAFDNQQLTYPSKTMSHLFLSPFKTLFSSQVKKISAIELGAVQNKKFLLFPAWKLHRLLKWSYRTAESFHLPLVQKALWPLSNYQKLSQI